MGALAGNRLLLETWTDETGGGTILPSHLLKYHYCTRDSDTDTGRLPFAIALVIFRKKGLGI